MTTLFTAFGLPQPVAEHRFATPRKWRFDYAWPDRLVALEVEGGVWTGGRHVSGAGFVRDIEKYNAAAVLGWRVLRCQPRDLQRSQIYGLLKSAMSADRRNEAGGAR